MMLVQGYRPVVEGLLLGLFFGAVVRTLIRAYVNARVQPIDPVAFSLVPIPLILAALAACYGPARRASRVDPNVALRHL
jgi:ABC-type lipoprotein release transport system permease subunit